MGASYNVDALVDQYLTDFVSDINILTHHNARSGLEDRYLAAEAPECLRKFEAAEASTENDQVCRDLVELESLDMMKWLRLAQTGNIGYGRM